MSKQTAVEAQLKNLIEENKKREHKYGLYQAILLDIFFVFYSILVVQRAIYYKFFLDLRDLPFSWIQIIIVFFALM